MTEPSPISYALFGQTPASVEAPATVAEAQAVVLRSAGRAIVPWGGGTRQALGFAPTRYDIALSTARLTEIVDYVPENLTVTCGAGLTVSALQTVLAAQGQWLPLDVACPGTQTLGGIVAARAGSLRRAAAHFELAVRVNTEEDLPQTWAESQNSLGYTHLQMADLELSEPERAEMLRRAIDFFQAAQRVWKKSDNAQRWGQSESNQGKAHTALPGPDRPASLQQALLCFQAALEVHTEQDFPADWADTQRGLGKAHLALAAETGNAAAREQAIACFGLARRGFLSVGHESEAAATEALLAAQTDQGVSS